MPRPYIQRARAETKIATRRRIIEAARAALVSGDVPKLELGDVAERAQVARSTIYLAFGTRSAFLSKILDDSLERAGFGRLLDFLTLSDAAEAMEKSLAQAASMYATEHAILRRLLLLAQLDPEVASMHAVRQHRRAAAMRELARRLSRQRRLRTGVTAEAAAQVLWLLTSFDTFDQLFSGWGMNAASCGARMVMLARLSLL